MAIYANENGSVKNLTGEFATLNSGINIVELDIPHLDITPAAFRSKILGWSGWGGGQIRHYAETIKTFDLGCTPEVILVDESTGYYNSEGQSDSLYMGIDASTQSSISYNKSGTILYAMTKLGQGEYKVIGSGTAGYPPIGLNSATIRRGSGQSQTTFNAYTKVMTLLFQLSGSQIIFKQTFRLNGNATASEASSTITVNDSFSSKWVLVYTIPDIK